MSVSTLLDNLLYDIDSMQWRYGQHDMSEHYMRQFSGREEWERGGFTMPCSPGVSSYELIYEQDPSQNVVFCRSQIKLRPGMVRVMNLVHPEQLHHRSRIAAVAFSCLRRQEFATRLEKAESAKGAIPVKLSSDKADQLYEMILNEYLSHMVVDFEYIQYYIHDHRSSSLAKGVKWSDCMDFTSEDWQRVLSSLQRVIHNLIDMREGSEVITPYLTGMRARSPGFEDELYNVDSSVNIEYMLTRSRLIFFHPALSSWSVFVPDKTLMYKNIFDKAMRIIGVKADNVYIPLVHGGEVYAKVSEWLVDGYIHTAYDGSSWDSQVGAILGRRFSPLLIRMGELQLGSGISLTSVLGTLAMLVMYVHYFNGERAVILGDDLNIFLQYEGKVITDNIAVGLEEADTSRNFVLGLSYHEDPLVPRLQGVKITGDRADRSIHLPSSLNEPGYAYITGKHSQSEQLLYYGMFFGSFGGKTLVEAVRALPPGKVYKGPTQAITDMIENK